MGGLVSPNTALQRTRALSTGGRSPLSFEPSAMGVAPKSLAESRIGRLL